MSQCDASDIAITDILLSQQRELPNKRLQKQAQNEALLHEALLQEDRSQNYHQNTTHTCMFGNSLNCTIDMYGMCV